MHKILLLLGLLRSRPMYGYELHQIIRAHGELYSDLKKANLYYLLERLATDGYLTVHTEEGTRGARGERLVYAITDKGQARFDELLRETLVSYEPVHTGVSTAVVFLSQLPLSEGIALLKQRREAVLKQRQATALSDPQKTPPLARMAEDHLLSLIDAELAWIDRLLAYLQTMKRTSLPTLHGQTTTNEAES
jgi:DNA-binding PadR family transcriptional regulator